MMMFIKRNKTNETHQIVKAFEFSTFRINFRSFWRNGKANITIILNMHTKILIERINVIVSFCKFETKLIFSAMMQRKMLSHFDYFKRKNYIIIDYLWHFFVLHSFIISEPEKERANNEEKWQNIYHHIP